MDIILINHAPTEEEYFGKFITTSDSYSRYPIDDKLLVRVLTNLSECDLIKKDFTVYSSPKNRTMDTVNRFQYLSREFFSINPQIKKEESLNELDIDFLDNVIKSQLTDDIHKKIKKWDSSKKNSEYLNKLLEFIKNHENESQLICFTHPFIIKLFLYHCLDKTFNLVDFDTLDISNFATLHIKVKNDKFKLVSLKNY